MTTEVKTQDVLPVRSRVSWGAILAGAFIALAVFILLNTLGLALGVTVADRADADTLGMGAGIWSAATLLIALFAGGCVASRCSVGETKTEAMFYGVLVWGVFLFFATMAAAGVAGAGIAGAVGLANSPAGREMAARMPDMSDDALRETGVSREEYNRLRERYTNNPAAAARDAANDPRMTAAAWWTFAGLILSIGAAIGGALVGAGPDLMLASVRVRSTAVTSEPLPR